MEPELHAPVPKREQILGCLLGGAVGDALGAEIEFMPLPQVRRRFGPAGVTEYQEAYGRRGAITNDTQMLLFTAEGLIRAHNRGRERGIVCVPSVVYASYRRWLPTQWETPGLESEFPDVGLTSS